MSRSSVLHETRQKQRPTRIKANGAGPELIPPLEAGDHLTRPEFERRYEAMPQLRKAELIEGIVYMPSPVSLLRHGSPDVLASVWIGTYVSETPGVEAGNNSTVKLDMENEPQPDCCLLILPECGGQVQLDEDGYIIGAPELIIEIASSSANYDLHAKLRTYQRSGVQEYITVLTRERRIIWHVLRQGKFEVAEPDADGVYHSEVFPGLVLDSNAMIDSNYKKVMATLSKSLRSKEHRAFVRKLSAVKSGKSR